jgi:hypothetical protein
MGRGEVDKRRLSVTAVALLALLIAASPSSAGAATQIGQTFAPNECPNDPATFLQGGSPGNQYAASSAGVITSWSFQAGGDPPQLKFKVARPLGADFFTIIGESALKTPAPTQLNTYTDIRISVMSGDVIGFYVASNDKFCSRNPAPEYFRHSVGSDVPLGTTTMFSELSDHQLDLSATLEPDCDGDGFGDETQDAEIPPIAACDPSAPETTITTGPKDKTRRRRATFGFTSSEPASSFQCAVDGQALKVPCTSPYTVKVKKGKHTFRVQATDQAGNVDGTPATDSWKVKKKRKKR